MKGSVGEVDFVGCINGAQTKNCMRNPTRTVVAKKTANPSEKVHED